MKTKVFGPSDSHIEEAAQIIRNGGLLGVPTETVYGLGANALDEEAVRHIFEAKGRPQDNPLIIHVANASWIERYCQDVPKEAYVLAEKFWPGPLTMILPRKTIVPLQTTGGLETVGIRCPNHETTLKIIEKAGVPIAAPSGNTSGRPSPTNAKHMLDDMDGKIDAIVDGGECSVGVESTIVDLTSKPARLLRPGGLALEDIVDVIGEVSVDKAVVSKLDEGEKPKAPGMKYRHYAPKAPVTVVTGAPMRSAMYIMAHAGDNVGVICFSEFKNMFAGKEVHELGSLEDKLSQAQHTFAALRMFDDTNVTEIYAQCPDSTGLGLAVGNRLKKAAGFHVVDVGNLIVLGLTGPTGAGKTSALRALEKLNALVLDCDAIYYEMLKRNIEFKNALIDAFGDIFDENGNLVKSKLGPRVFQNPEELNKLNNIVYFYMEKEILRRINSCMNPVVAIDAINLIESGFVKFCNKTIAITAPVEERVKRIMARDNISEEYARMRIAAQKDDAFYKENCDDVLINKAKSPEEFEEAAYIYFWNAIRELSK